MSLKLYGYWRSTASYRVRIALNLKGVQYEYVPVHLVKEGGEQHAEPYSRLNPAHLVPTLVDEDEDIILNQSLSIIEYIDERFDSAPRLVPEHKTERARVRALAQDIACDIQPLGNLRVLNALKGSFDAQQEDVQRWAAHWISLGFDGIEQRLQTQAGKYCFDFDVTLADVCLIPQVYNAKRFNLDMNKYPLISKIADNCNALEAFEKAKPENQIDAS
ncbi:MAG: maleylacetoacetate isomerase [Pseudomonadota bacterium]|jgi:maleylacetoacetate isomerase|uniref:maleylacetoacetate isomerase n=1 Tax=unclassified Alteromonas TaxID=2614992 RepID=UPI002E9D67DA|nr:maleylacetoacetate isomerase [Pseudomonadota bacterium]MEC8417337.1 maleylacetoacetate isomerase [Pseudomonadota bacterium]